MFTVLILFFVVLSILVLEQSTRQGWTGRLRAKSMQQKKFDPEVADSMTGAGGMFMGMTIIVVLMAVVQNFVDLAG